MYREDYLSWKGWDVESFGHVSGMDARYFEAEVRRTGLNLRAGLSVLEIGFGNGQFMGFAAQRGWRVAGTELNSELVNRARAKGFEATASRTLEEFEDDRFDLVVAFDVLEHIQQSEMMKFLEAVRRVLRPGGMFLARFPNGDSPFGLSVQNGDVTHVTTIGMNKIIYFARELRASVHFLGGEIELINTGNLSSSIYRLFAVPLRRVLNLLVRLIFFPRSKISFCSANLVVVLRAESSNAELS